MWFGPPCRYSCLMCRFFSDAPDKHYYHCADCGICRVGAPNQYFHCKTCNACYAIEIKDTHVCVENSMHQNCPVCFEYLFDSTKQITVLPCGHTIHATCLRVSYRSRRPPLSPRETSLTLAQALALTKPLDSALALPAHHTSNSDRKSLESEFDKTNCCHH